MDESGSDIVVNQPVYGMNSRSVTLRGAPKQIAIAVSKIYTTLEKYAYSVDEIERKAVIDFNSFFRSLSKRIKSSLAASLLSRKSLLDSLLAKKAALPIIFKMN
jgi:hypothetical protein